MNYDVIIIGKGPAGISAALYLGRTKHSILVLGKDFGALERAESIENYYGMEKPLRGIELAERGVRQVEDLGVTVKTGEAVSIEQVFPETQNDINRFALHTADSREYKARTVLLATGKQRIGLNVPGFTEYQGHGISFCAVCDGFFYRGKKIGVVGNGFYAAAELNHLYPLSQNVRLFTNGMPLVNGVQDTLPKDIVIVKEKIKSLHGSAPAQKGGKLNAVEIFPQNQNDTDVQNLHRLDGLFIAMGTAGAADFAAKLGIQTGSGANAGSLIVNENFQTNLPGLYAAGDAAGGYLQVAKAVSDGAHAAKYIIKELRL